MGVHGLNGHLRRISARRPPDEHTILSPGSTLALDGLGLTFHLFRVAYGSYRSSLRDAGTTGDAALDRQLRLPANVPLTLLHDVTTDYLTSLTVRHGLKVRVYLDGPDQRMKSAEHRPRGTTVGNK